MLAGRDILKTVRVNDTTCAEDFNLRANITAYASAHNASREAVSAQHRDQLTANDVKWSYRLFNTTLATAASSGRIVIYDINRPSVEIARLHEHARQVHKLAFNPHQGALLISGSQDGTVRMWDLRALQGDRSVRVTGSIKRFFGNSEGIRDVRWSPTDAVEFAAGTDSGVVQRWDFRKESAPLLKLNAHDKACHSIDWHPSGKYLASAGGDKQVKVWDFKSVDRRMKPSWHVRASQSVLNARWRPIDQTGEGTLGSQVPTQLATSYVGKDPRIHVWDFTRPNVPCQEFECHENPASDILWHSENRLWSVGTAGVFMQTDMSSMPRPLDRQNANVIGTAPDGRFCFFSDARARRRISFADADEEMLRTSDTDDSSGARYSSSFNATEESLEETSILSTSLPVQRHRSLHSKSIQGNGTTARRETPTREGEAIVKDTVILDPTFQTTQIAASGYVLGVFDGEAFKHLARNYFLPVLNETQVDAQFPRTIRSAFEHNATIAAQTGQHRLGQTWRIVGLATQRALEARAKDNEERQSTKETPSRSHLGPKEDKAVLGRNKNSQDSHHDTKSLRQLLQPTVQIDSSSNVATPLARPVQDLPSVPGSDEDILDPNSFQDQDSEVTFMWQLRRPSIKPMPALEASASGENTPWLPISPKSQSIPTTRNSDSSTTSPIFEEIADTDDQLQRRLNALKDYRGQPKTVLRLDEPEESGQRPGIPMRVERHDSNESFQMFSASVESDARSIPLVGSFGDSQRSDASDQASASLGTSMRQDVANNILSRRIPTQYDQRRPSVQQPTSFQPPSMLGRKDSAGQEDASANARIHDQVQRPSINVAPEILVNRNNPEHGEGPILAPTSAIGLFMPHKHSHEHDSAGSPPWTLPSILPRLLEYHLETLSDTQFPSFLALYLAPFFPSLFAPTLRTTAHLRAYHSQLTSLQLYAEAAAFRDACAARFPELASALTFGAGKASLWCRNCSKAVKGEIKGLCTRCAKKFAPCGVCEMEKPPLVEHLRPDEKNQSEHLRLRISKLWAWCQGCGHGGHSSCMRTWWTVSSPGSSIPGDVSRGVCPIAGCGHDCVPGPERGRRRREAEVEKGKAKGAVAKDDWVAGESRAVESARRLVVAKERKPWKVGGAARRVRVLPPEVGAEAGRDGEAVG